MIACYYLKWKYEHNSDSDRLMTHYYRNQLKKKIFSFVAEHEGKCMLIFECEIYVDVVNVMHFFFIKEFFVPHTFWTDSSTDEFALESIELLNFFRKQADFQHFNWHTLWNLPLAGFSCLNCSRLPVLNGKNLKMFPTPVFLCFY